MALLLMILQGDAVFAQAFPIFNGTTNTCAGAFLDSGGQGASGYGNNENYTYTICPDQPGGAISLNFLTFNLSTAGAAPIDLMAIYDGNSTAAPLLGNWTGTGLQGQVISASSGNSSGCLTVVFRSNGSGTGVFAATITCYQPCARPTAVATHGAANPQLICPGESVTFNSTASFAAPGFSIATRTWDFGDGTVLNNAPAVVAHTYAQPGAYTAQLYLVDNNGCASTNLVDLVTMVGTPPTFTGTTGTLTGCVSETLCLTGVVNGTTWNELPESDLGGSVALPDDVGSCFTSELTFSQFPPGQTLTDVNDLLSICMEMEHSFIGDLIISIISPTGETVVLHQQGGGGTFLGVPVDDDFQPNEQGTCWNYCFSPTATNGTWVDNTGVTLPSGTYESLNPLSGLVGSQLNGTWTIQVCDMWASDNGFICNWGLTFDPSLYDDLIEFTPVYGAACDSTYWTGPNITSNSAGCDQPCVTPPAAGSYTYTYHVTDNFGCNYDTTLTVTIVPGPQVNAGPDASTCNTPVQLGASVSSGGFATNCNYTLTLYDSFGDGWTGLFGGSNGSNVTITVNGTPSSWTLLNGSQGSTTIPVTSGSTISISYTVGSTYNGEQSFTLFNSTGAVVYASPQGPGGGVLWSGTATCPGGNFVYSWTPTTGLSNPNIPNPTATVGGTTTYCVTVYQQGHPACSSTDCMTITVDNTLDPGTNGSLTLCANGPATNLLNALGGTPTAGGTWTNPSGAAHSGMFVPGADPPGIYTYTVSGSGACGSTAASSTVSVTVSPLADAGLGTNLTVCSTDAPFTLFSQLGGSPQAGGTWTAPGGGSFNGTFTPGTSATGAYTYTVPGTAPCPAASATITLGVNTPPDAGADDVVSLCSSSAPIVLVNYLGGTPDGTGTWTGPGGAVVPGGLDPAVDPGGVYTYTVGGAAPCPNDVATLTVTIAPEPDAGTDGSITLCSSDAAVSLFAQLGGTPDAGGAWSGPSAVTGGQFDPATMTAGVYTYTVNGIAPCPAESSTVTVAVNTPPDPGTDGSITLCSSDAAVSLFTQLGGTPDAGGAWSGPSAVAGGQFDPATMSAGVYTYTVNGIAPCPSESSTVTVAVNTPSDPGTDGSISLCSSDAAVSLFAQLGGTPDAGGAWSGPSAVIGEQFDPATMSAGVYTYTVNGIAPCPAESSTVTVAVNTPPDPGTDGSITLCSSDAAVSLFAQLGGTPDAGGAWSGPSAVTGGQFDPATMTAGVYTYTVNGIAPCPAESSTVTVAVNTPPDPGTDGSITLCSSDAAVSLFTQLGGTPDAGGAWSGPSAVAGGQFYPATMTAGVYTYTVNGIAPCPAESSTVTVAVNTPPDPGTDGSITLCSSDAAVSLIAQLAGTPDAGGAWNGPSAVTGGQFDPTTMSAGIYTYTVNGIAPCPAESSAVTVNVNALPDAGLDGGLTLCSSSPATPLFSGLNGSPDAGGTWTGPGGVVSNGTFTPGTTPTGIYTYTVTGQAPCPSDAATVTVNVVTNPDAGTPGAITLCASDTPTLLGGTPDAGGSWSGPSAVNGGLYDPATMAPGVYTYTISVPPPCVNASSTVTVTEVAPPNAGDDGALTLCISSPATVLFNALTGAPQTGGTWIGPSAVMGGQFDPATMLPGVYTYTLAGTAPCPADQASVTVNVVNAPDAGTPGAITSCSSDAPFLLFDLLGGTPDVGGMWSGPSAVSGGLYDPATMASGVYTYTISVPPPCVNASSTVTVTEVAPPNAGDDGALTLCISSPAAVLFNALSGAPQTGGNWSGPSAVVGGQFDPATMLPGVYTYTLAGTTPCPADQASVTVTVVSEPDAGGPGFITLCAADAPVDLFASLEGSPDQGGLWTSPAGITTSGSFDPATMTGGVYTYTIAVPPPCASVSSTVTVDVVQPPNAGADGSITVCLSGAAVDLFSALGGTPEAGGAWTSATGAGSTGTFTPSTDAPGVFTYTVSGTPPCPADIATVTVNVTLLPNAGTDSVINLCAIGDAIDLYPALGTADAGGSWSGPSGASDGTFDPGSSVPGGYTYTVSGTAPCPSASATIQVNVLANADAGDDGTLTVCASDAAVDLFDQLGGSPDGGGAWTAPDGTPSSSVFEPSTAMAGTYTYIVFVPAPCVNDTANVFLNVIVPVDAGEDGALTVCANDAPIDLMTVIGGTPLAGGNWNGPAGATDGIFTPGTSAPGTYTYTVQGTAPCPNDAAVVVMTTSPLPDAGTNGSISLCPEVDPVDLFELLGGNPEPDGSWTGPNGQPVDALFIPGTDPAGVYTYTVNGIAPCPNATASATVTVYVVPAANAGPDQVVCDLDAALAATGTWASGQWSGPGGVLFDDTSAGNTGISASAGGSVQLTWSTTTAEGCSSSDQVTITFTDAIIPTLSTTNAICNGACDGSASVSTTGGNGAYSYQWTGGVAGNTAQASGLCAGSYAVTISDVNGCSVQAPFTIEEPAPLVIDLVVPTNETCPGSCDGTVVVQDAEGVQYSLNGGPAQPSASFQGLCPGEYAVTMTDANGCLASATAVVGTPAPVIAYFTTDPDTVLVSEPEVTFTNGSSPNATDFAWDFGGLASSTATNPTYVFPGTLGGNYTVCLTAMDANGCEDTYCAPVQVFDALVVHVANAFSPNDDDVNEGFAPVFNMNWAVGDYEFLVFDRWGELLFETHELDAKWNGIYGGGTVETEVFVWRLRCRDMLTREWIERVGHVTVLK
ncbi:MAG TPA: PKD domain-containing protein [Flavobacteriales bacterium]|nr:PKD domain-containing protein [Flavobacteriales bacterium]